MQKTGYIWTREEHQGTRKLGRVLAKPEFVDYVITPLINSISATLAQLRYLHILFTLGQGERGESVKYATKIESLLGSPEASACTVPALEPPDWHESIMLQDKATDDGPGLSQPKLPV
ncbi:hypothetical protein AXG93_1669s1050 [Marchantia polymorpha subsp. ruderalis]|uniref:Uncharacterized protein n=1 Tax=Marchantia polymorpha subsp. ruderalis TaxID=1480154 RepID=A0A176W402_MARPO|nr:hypothetical protein AXG93_1669s1050 [Marchantia polymorpha subsp. ruderalis]